MRPSGSDLHNCIQVGFGHCRMASESCRHGAVAPATVRAAGLGLIMNVASLLLAGARLCMSYDPPAVPPLQMNRMKPRTQQKDKNDEELRIGGRTHGASWIKALLIRRLHASRCRRKRWPFKHKRAFSCNVEFPAQFRMRGPHTCDNGFWSIHDFHHIKISVVQSTGGNCRVAQPIAQSVPVL